MAGAAKRTVEGNEAACAHCWCYVCQCPVAECRQWTSLDIARPAHCNAHGGNVMWKRERMKELGGQPDETDLAARRHRRVL